MRSRFAIKLIIPSLIAGTLAIAAYAAGRSETGPGLVQFLSSYVLSAKPDWFGGFSAVALSPDGSRVVVLTDRSHLVEGSVQRTNGKITQVTFDTHVHLRNSNGKMLLSGRDSVDSEGIALAKDGTVYVSFEGRARVSRYVAIDEAEHELPRPKAFTQLQKNKALEALAIDAQGQLYTLPENFSKDAFPVWRWNGQDWDMPFQIKKHGRYLPVGLDIGPDGRLYLLERKFVLVGFRSRIRRWELTDSGLSAETVLMTTPVGTHDNLEGLSIWRASDGDLRATMVSDNNFMPFQRSELVEYRLSE